MQKTQLEKILFKWISFFFLLSLSLHSKLFAAAPNFCAGLELESENIAMARFFVHQTYLFGDAIARSSGPGVSLDDMTIVHGRDVYKIQWFRESNPLAQGVNDHVGFLARQTHRINDAKEKVEIDTISRIFVAFRGSHWVNDWIRNTIFPFVQFRDQEGRVHRGFYERYRAIQDGAEIGVSVANDAIVNQESGFIKFLNNNLILSGITRDNCEFIFVGHSTGSALATLACAEMASAFDLVKNQAKLITFSSPMVGDRAFVDGLTEQLGKLNICRFYCCTDIVPHLPFSRLGYEHAGIGIPFRFVEIAGNDYDSAHADVLNYSADTIWSYSKIIREMGVSLFSIQFLRKSHAMPNRELVRDIFVEVKNSLRRGIPVEELGNSAFRQSNRGVTGFLMKI